MVMQYDDDDRPAKGDLIVFTMETTKEKLYNYHLGRITKILHENIWKIYLTPFSINA